MALVNRGLKEFTRIIIILGLLLGVVAPGLQVFFNFNSTRIVIVSEIILLIVLLVEALLIKNQRRWKMAILIGLPLLIADIFARIYQLYRIWAEFDIFGHFWAGVAITAGLYLIYQKRFKFIFIFSIVSAFVWEIAELVQDEIFKSITPPWLTDSIGEGFSDIGLQILGTLITYALIKRYEKKLTDNNQNEHTRALQKGKKRRNR